MNRMSYRANDSIPSIPPPSYHPLEVLGSPLTNNSGGGHVITSAIVNEVKDSSDRSSGAMSPASAPVEIQQVKISNL